MDDIDFSKKLFSRQYETLSGTKARTVAAVTEKSSTTTTIIGTASSDSINGYVLVDLGGKTIGQDASEFIDGDTSGVDQQSVSLPTTVTVYFGDSVMVSCIGASGTAKRPTVIGVVGGGDRTTKLITSKSTNFTTTPVPPYAIGDTWTDLENNVVYTATVSRTESDIFTKSDWSVTGKAGKDTVYVTILSSNGESFKNGNISTDLDVYIHYGNLILGNQADLASSFGSGMYLQWYTKGPSDTDYVKVSTTDSHISGSGFAYSVTGSDVSTKKIFRCTMTDGTNVYATGQITITNISDGYSVHLSSESVTVQGTVLHAKATMVSTTVSALLGTNKEKVTVDLSKITGIPTGITVSKSELTYDTTLTFTITTEFSAPASIDIPLYIPKDGITIHKFFDIGIAFAGLDAITLKVESTNGLIFKDSSISTTLVAHVYESGTELSASDISKIGTIKWYVNGSTTSTYTGTSITITSGSVVNTATYMAVLES